MDKAKLGCVARSMQFDHGSTTAFSQFTFLALRSVCSVHAIEYTSHLKTWDHPPPRRDDRARGAGRGAFIVLFL